MNLTTFNSKISNYTELLAPAGSSEAFRAAVENGADAVYIGLSNFSARQFAKNVNLEELEKLTDYAHGRNVSVYLTMNTLIMDEEMKAALDTAKEAYLKGIDAVIVQDIGFAENLKNFIPELSLHGSTQMSIYNLDGVVALEKKGFDRVVLARELNICEIKHICDHSKAQIEVFVHGALCVCYSGQCLMSSAIGARSGNRGKCAQPCRLKYDLMENDKVRKSGFLLSTKDLCTLENIKEIIESGVKSLKIEGRMKSPAYVGASVNAYRREMDRINSDGDKRTSEVNPDNRQSKAICNEGKTDNSEGKAGNSKGKTDNSEGKSGNSKGMLEEKNRLKGIFNRGGFTKGFVHGEKGSSIMYDEHPGNTGIFLGKVEKVQSDKKLVSVALEANIHHADYIEIRNGNEKGFSVSSIVNNGNKVKEGNVGDKVVLGFCQEKISIGDKLYKTFDKNLNDEIEALTSGKSRKKVAINLKISIKKDSKLKLELVDGENSIIQESSYIPEVAVVKAVSQEKVIEQMGKMGDSPFFANIVQVDMDEGLVVPVSELNAIRRDAVEKLLKKKESCIRLLRQESEVLIKQNGQINQNADYLINGENLISMGNANGGASHGMGNMGDGAFGVVGNVCDAGKLANKKQRRLSLQLYNTFKFSAQTFENIDRLYIPAKDIFSRKFPDKIKELKKVVAEVFISLPSITKGFYDENIGKICSAVENFGLDGILTGNISHIETYGEVDTVLASDYSWNVVNSASVNMAEAWGNSTITLSPELNFQQLNSLLLDSNCDYEYICYGRLPLMISEYCPLGVCMTKHNEKKACDHICKKDEKFYLKDRMAKKMPIICDELCCRSIIFNADKLYLLEEWDKMKKLNINFYRLIITDESESEVKGLIELHKEVIIDRKILGGSKQLLQYARSIKEQGFTKGHFLRGI